MRRQVAAIGSLLVCGVMFAVFTQAAYADASGINLTTSPIVTTLNGKPGGSTAMALHVQNNGVNPVTVNVSLETFRAVGTSGAAQVTPIAGSDPSGSWVHFSQSSFVAQPGIWSSITMTVTLPKDAGLGYYYAVVFKQQVSSAAPGLGSSVKGGNVILVLVNAASADEHPSIAISKFSTDKKLYEYLPATFSVAVKNNGNIFLAPTGDIYISKDSGFTHTIDTIPVNYSYGNVLAGTSRIFTAAWSDGFPVYQPKTVDGNKITDKNGQVEQVLNWNLTNANKLRFGKYYAKLALAYNNGSRDVPLTAVVSFWVVPWKILLVGLAALVMLLVGLYATGKKVAARTMRFSQKVKSHQRVGKDDSPGAAGA